MKKVVGMIIFLIVVWILAFPVSANCYGDRCQDNDVDQTVNIDNSETVNTIDNSRTTNNVDNSRTTNTRIDNTVVDTDYNTDISVDDSVTSIDNSVTKISSVSSTTIISEDRPEYLSVGDAAYTRVIYPDRFALVPVRPGETYQVLAGSPVGLWTIEALYVNTVKDSRSALTYDEVYDRMDHHLVPFVDVVPYYTTKSTITISEGAAYLIVDNRNPFTKYNLVEISVLNPEGKV
jgi:hypothetical protein